MPWAGPLPSRAKISLTSKSIFDATASALGAPSLDGLRREYLSDLSESEVFNASMAWTIEEAAAGYKRYGFQLASGAGPPFSRYLERAEDASFLSLVGNP